VACPFIPLCENGHVHGQMVSLFLLSGETHIQIDTMVEMFANCNPVTQAKTFIVDKDFNEVSAFLMSFRMSISSCAHFIVLKPCKKG